MESITPCKRVPTRPKQLFTVATLLYRFLSCWCLAKSTFLRSRISRLQFVACLFFFWLIRSFADPTYTFSSIIVRGPLHILLLLCINGQRRQNSGVTSQWTSIPAEDSNILSCFIYLIAFVRTHPNLACCSWRLGHLGRGKLDSLSIRSLSLVFVQVLVMLEVTYRFLPVRLGAFVANFLLGKFC